VGDVDADMSEHPTDAILHMLDATAPIIARRHQSLRNVVIVRDNTVLCARAYYGFPGVADAPAMSSDKTITHKNITGNKRHPDVISPIHSVTKSVMALLIGALIDRGLIKSVQQTLLELLPSRAELIEETPVAALTLHQLLSMTPGLLWRNARAGLEPMVGRMVRQPDWVAFTLSLPVEVHKIGQFQYNSAVSHVLSAIVHENSGQQTADFAFDVLFRPLGIDCYEWESDPQLLNIGGWGLSLSSLSMAKIGQLCISGGRFQGKPVISADWITQMWTPQVEANSLHAQHQPADHNATQYGYQWWVRGNEQIQLYCAEGLGGQAIYCIPAHRVVIVTSSDYPARRSSLWPLFEQHWIPAAVASS